MEPALGAKLLGLALFLVLAALAAAAQACLFHVNRARLRGLADQGTPRAQAVLQVLEQPGTSFGSVAGLYTLSLVAAAALAFMVGQTYAPLGAWVPPVIALGAVTAALLLQSIARAIAIARPEASALLLYRPLHLILTPLAPVLGPFRLLERRLLALFGAPNPNDPHSAEDELRLLVESGEESGVLEEDEREMIHGIFELSEVTAREVMVPRIDVAALPEDVPVGEVLDKIVETGHSRLPIYQGSVDNVIGIVYAKDLLKHLRSGSLSDPVRPLARPAYFVPEAKKVDELLQELQQRRVHIAVVVDEYGGTAGLITIEDLLEEIVGEIQDEFDHAEEARVQQVNDREAIIDARTSIRDVNDLLSLNLPDDEFDTLGGLVYDRLGKVPATDDRVEVDGCSIQVMTTEGRRIKKVRLVMGQAS